MKTVRVKFADFYGSKPENIWAYQILTRFYDVQIVDRDPEYLLDGGLGSEHLDYPNAVKMVFIGESYVPDFNQFDYAVGFDHLTFGDRYLRIPLFAFYGTFRDLCSRPPALDLRPRDCEALAHRGFCSFVVSNDDGDPMRLEFFKRLSKYKPVASGGKIFNNVGGRVPDKGAFIARYKFNIAFENSRVPGYTTEKVMEPLAARSVPVYYGNPLIAEDFDPACMVHLASRDDVDRAIEEIIALDRDDDAYVKKLLAPTFRHPQPWYEERLTAFLRNVFDRPLAEARRLNDFGYQPNIRRHQQRAQAILNWSSPRYISRKLRGKI